MIDDFLAVIHDAKLGGAITRFIKRVLVAAIDPHMAQRYAGQFLELPANPAPIHRLHDGGKVFMSGFFMKELCEYFLWTLQPFGFAALSMNDRVSVVKALDAAPGKCADLYGFARHFNLGPLGSRPKYRPRSLDRLL
jgi:hypothetical protein